MDKKKMAVKGVKKTQVYIDPMDDSEPTEKEKEMMRQMLREKKMDEGTNRGANQYKDTRILEEKAKGGMVPGYSKGGSVSKGNGIAIRGIRKCKMC